MSKVILNKEEIKNKYQSLLSGKIDTEQKRGFEFENLIFSLLQNAKVEPKASYKSRGEQVDGSFFWNGQTFLLEAKWEKKPIPVSSIYAFKGKLDGKFHTTSGIFISVSGFSYDVEDALRFGKSLNILLFDKDDVNLLFNGEVNFLEMLKFKLRQAGDTGSLRVPYKLKEEVDKISETNPELLQSKPVLEEIDSIHKSRPLIDDLLIFVEGKSDISIAHNFLEPLKEKFSLSYKIVTLNGANNIRKIPSLLNVYGTHQKTKAVIIILDNDQLTNQMNGVVQNVTEQLKKSSIPINSIVLYLSHELKEKLVKNTMSVENINNESVFEKLDTFIKQIEEEYYYDPTTYVTPSEVLKYRLDNLEWNFEEHEVITDGYPISITSLNELISYLNDEIINAVYDDMPTEWKKEQTESLDYDYDVREYLRANYSTKIHKIGWDTNDL